MRVLNTYTEISGRGFGFLVITVLLILAIFVLRGDIERLVMHFFNGFVYAHASQVWMALVVVVAIIFFVPIVTGWKPVVYAEATIQDNYPVVVQKEASFEFHLYNSDLPENLGLLYSGFPN